MWYTWQKISTGKVIIMKETVYTKNAPSAKGLYSQATINNGTLYVSGQLPINPETGKIQAETITEQTHQVMKNLTTIVEAAGGKLENALKCTVLLTDIAHFAQMNEVYASYFPADPPARICYQVSALPLGAIVEIDAICAL
jgi:2-iminobutanoate/2-iminopropanoate deaminase